MTFKKLSTSAIILAGTMSLVLAGCTEEFKKFTDNSGEAATYKGGKVTNAEVLDLAKQVTGNQTIALDTLNPETKQAFIKEIVARKILDEQAKKAGIAKDKTVAQALDNLSAQFLRQEFLIKKAEETITEDSTKARYNELTEMVDGKEEFKVRHILVSDQAKAQDIRNKISSGALSFEAAAREFSKDSSSAKQGGQLRTYVPGQLNKDFEAAAAKLQPNQISEPVKTSFGWHIIQLEERKPAKAAAYEQAKIVVQQEMKRDFVQKYMADILTGADIKFANETKPAANESEPKTVSQ